MGDSKLSNLIQITNKKIEFLNSHLDNYGVNRFYKVPPINPTKQHTTRMIHDLDYLVVRSEVDASEFKKPYLEVRGKLFEIKQYLSDKEESGDQSAER